MPIAAVCKTRNGIRRAAALVVLAASCVAPAALHGQFTPPTPEELKMTSDPKAPGADAVYLNYEEIDDASSYRNKISIYTRIKILSDKARDLATIKIEYDRDVSDPKAKPVSPLANLSARTIHADGTILPLDAKPEELLETRIKNTETDQITFTLPGVEPGCILEYRYDLNERFPLPHWRIQKPYFIHHLRLAFLPATNVSYGGGQLDALLYSTVLPDGVSVSQDKDGHFALDTNDVPALSDEAWMPPIDSFAQQVNFYYYNQHVNGKKVLQDFWKEEGQYWSGKVDDFASFSFNLRSAAHAIVGEETDEAVKARKLYDAVQALDNTSFSREKSAAERKQMKIHEIKHTDDVWKQKSGDSDEIAVLYMAMAKSVGLKAYAFWVTDRNRGIFNPYRFTFDQLDDYLVIVSINGKEILLDPGQKMCPFGHIHWKHALAGGLRQTSGKATLATTAANPYSDAVLFRGGDMNIDEQGNLVGTIRFLMRGPVALRWRQDALLEGEDEVKTSFTEWVRSTLPTGVTATFDHFINLDNSSADLVGVAKISGSPGSQTGKRTFLPGVLFGAASGSPFVKEDKRQNPIDMQYGEVVRDEITYYLPAGFQVESLPPDQKIPWPGNAQYTLKATANPDIHSVTLSRSLAQAFVLLPAKDYPQLHDFYQKVAAADQQQLVLTSAKKTAAANPTSPSTQLPQAENRGNQAAAP